MSATSSPIGRQSWCMLHVAQRARRISTGKLGSVNAGSADIIMW
jgi:hypothetical protein